MLLGLTTGVSHAAQADMPTSPPAVPLSNDQAHLTPVTTFTGPSLKFDFPALHIGMAEYAEGPTGCTVFHFPEGATAAMDVRGGSPGLIMEGDGWVDAICFAGGSLLGLEAATGVVAELFAQKKYASDFENIPLVRGAIIYDFGPRSTSIYPDKALGRAALKSARPGLFPLGPHGGGRSASCGPGLDWSMAQATGQGGAFRQVGSIKLGVFTLVNALGAIHDRQGRVIRGFYNQVSRRHLSYMEMLERNLAMHTKTEPRKGNTNLTVVVTNQKLSPRSLSQFGRQVHTSMARAIQPFHTLMDGDVLFAVSTNELDDDTLDPVSLGVIASELAWDAVLTCFDPA